VPAEYSLLILLPAPVERELSKWIEQTPGGTLPYWGAHVTLLSDFTPAHGIAAVKRATAQVCTAFTPFVVRFDQVLDESHWRRPQLHAVLLFNRPRAMGHRPLVQLQRELANTLAPLKRDLDPKVSRRVFKPHTSLTWGLPRREAQELGRAAQAAHLKVEFTVDRIWLMEFTPTSSAPQHVKRVRSFMLGPRAKK
jgi:2'-5' RNA ligase